MKRIGLFVVLAIAVAMNSCLDNVHSDYTPEIAATPIICSNGDTLSFQYDSDISAYAVDTFATTDTVRFSALFNAVGNNLISTTFQWDTTALNLVFGPLGDIATILTDTSDTTKGIFNFQLGYYFVAIPITIIPQAAQSSRITMTVISDSKFSPSAVSLFFTAKD